MFVFFDHSWEWGVRGWGVATSRVSCLGPQVQGRARGRLSERRRGGPAGSVHRRAGLRRRLASLAPLPGPEAPGRTSSRPLPPGSTASHVGVLPTRVQEPPGREDVVFQLVREPELLVQRRVLLLRLLVPFAVVRLVPLDAVGAVGVRREQPAVGAPLGQRPPVATRGTCRRVGARVGHPRQRVPPGPRRRVRQVEEVRRHQVLPAQVAARRGPQSRASGPT